MTKELIQIISIEDLNYFMDNDKRFKPLYGKAGYTNDFKRLNSIGKNYFLYVVYDDKKDPFTTGRGKEDDYKDKTCSRSIYKIPNNYTYEIY